MAASPAEVQYQMAHINEDNGGTAVAVISVFGAIALVTLIWRIVIRIRGVGLGLDDYLMIIGGVLTFVQVLTVYELVHWGLGKHAIAVPPSNFIPIGKWTVVSYFSYPAAIAFIKWSILAQIARIFTMQDLAIKIGVWVLGVYTFLWLSGLWLATGLVCQPFSSLWSTTSPCEVPYVTTLSSTILDIVSDFAVILLPQHAIWRLEMSSTKKILVSALMTLGIFCSVTGIVRIEVTKHINVMDVTFQTIPLIFVCLEPILAIICGCLPATQGPMFHAILRARDGFLYLSNMSRSRFSDRGTRNSGRGKDSKQGSSGVRSDGGSYRQFSGKDIESQTPSQQTASPQQIRKNTTIEMTSAVDKSSSRNTSSGDHDEYPLQEFRPSQ